MSKIIIPTDFSTKSLQLVEYAVLNKYKNPISILLVHGYHMSYQYWDMIHFSKSEIINQLCSEEFKEMRRILLLEHKFDIAAIDIDLFMGNNSVAFQSLLNQHHITHGLIPNKPLDSFSNRRSFDPTQFIKKTVKNLKIVPFMAQSTPIILPQLSLMDLF